jgi:hypothetical protein
MRGMAEKRLINVRVTDGEDALLTAYAERSGRTKSDVLRELIRSLEPLKARPKRARAG